MTAPVGNRGRWAIEEARAAGTHYAALRVRFGSGDGIYQVVLLLGLKSLGNGFDLPGSVVHLREQLQDQLLGEIQQGALAGPGSPSRVRTM